MSNRTESVARILLEAYRKTYGYRTTHRGQRVSWDEPGERDDSLEVIAHNKALARQRERERKKREGRDRLKSAGAVPKKAGRPMFEQKKTPNIQSQIGQTYYSICPDDDRYYRTIYIRHNPFTNALEPKISNAVMGTPPDGINPISPLMLQRLMRTQMSTTFMGF